MSLSLKNKVILLNATIFLAFLALIIFVAIRLVSTSYDSQFEGVKNSVIKQNRKLIEAFVEGQDVLLDVEADLILEKVESSTKSFKYGCGQKSSTKNDYYNLKCITDVPNEYLKSVAYVNLDANKEVRLDHNGFKEYLYDNSKIDLWLYKKYIMSKHVNDQTVDKFFLYNKVDGFERKYLKFELDLEYFARSLSFENMDQRYQYQYMIIDKKGVLIASNLKQNANGFLRSFHLNGTERKTLKEYVLLNKSGFYTVNTGSNVYNIIFKKNVKTEWKIILVFPESLIRSNYLSITDFLEHSDNLLLEKLSAVTTILFLIVLGVSSIFVNKSFKPMRKLIKQADYLKDQEFVKAIRVIRHGGDEIEQLSQAYSQAGEKIKIMIDSLESEVKVRSEQYEIAAAEALDANKNKSVLLSNVSHEIRTPLNAIIGYSHMLSKQKIELDSHHFIKGIATASNTILNIVDDLLDFERLDSVNYTLEPKKVCLMTILEHLRKTFHPLAEDKGIYLNIITEDIKHTQYLFVDELRLNQALSNIISNAIKFTNKGLVEVSVGTEMIEETNMLTFSVRDTGKGIKAEHLDTIFNSFEQVNQEDKQFGFGLGLAITKAIVTLMNGKIVVESEYGGGSLFKLCLPLNVLLDKNEQVKIEQLSTMPVDDKQNRFHGVKALVVDDVEFNREILQHHLNELGIECSEAEDGVEALELLKSAQFQVILTDISMPRMGGVELAVACHSIEPNLPVIAVTARATVQEEEAMAHHFNSYITKPIEQDKVLMALAKAFDDKCPYQNGSD
ncbi:ATP-binding response regulator [Vibrio jasicida]|uniref:ATP-binding response regulator n=1 Tax=Vibrio jasicida TaxID=766224 RepID=UPI004067D9A7